MNLRTLLQSGSLGRLSTGPLLQDAVARFLNMVMAIGAVGLAIGAGLQMAGGLPLYSAAIDGAGALFFGLLLLLRRRIGAAIKLVLIALYLGLQIYLSLLNSGLMGTGEVMIALLIVLTAVVMRPLRGLLISLSAVMTIFLFSFLLRHELVSFPGALSIQHNDPMQWILQGVTLAVFALFAVSVIHYFRSTLLSTIGQLEETNTALNEVNEELAQRRNQIYRLAYFDRFTGLPNRIKFKLHVLERISSGVEQAHLVLFDVHKFRIVNALYGNRFGDRILQAIGGSFRGKMAPGRYIARLGSDEFAMWIEGEDTEGLHAVVAELTAGVSAHLEARYALKHRIEFYSAAARFPDDGRNYQECARAAGAALKHGKEHGSTSLICYSRAIMRIVERESQVRSLLERALNVGQFELVYQRKVNIRTGTTVGVEALARWNPPELGEVPPEEFIRYCTDWGLIVPFSKYILQRVLEDIPLLSEQYGPEVQVSINISPAMFLDGGFPTYIRELLASSAVSPRRLVFEITEDVFVEDFERIRGVFEILQSLGIGLALDDFGKGYSALSYIRALQFNELKVDRFFIEHITTDWRNYALFQSICDIAAVYGSTLVAEGVETEEQVQALLGTGCDIVQGFYYSTPAPLQSPSCTAASGP
jgi:diguanylate cyclase (GGDEF)-like protein